MVYKHFLIEFSEARPGFGQAGWDRQRDELNRGLQ